MNTFWAQQAQRINALSLRERAIMFISLAVAMAAVSDALVLSPRLAEQKSMATQLKKQAAELDDLRSKLANSTTVASADSPQGRLQAARAERAALEAEIQRRSAGNATTGLPELLERVLKRHERLTLLRLATATPQAARDSAMTPQAARDSAMTPQAARDSAMTPQAARDSAAAPQAARNTAMTPQAARDGAMPALPQSGVDLSLSGSFPDLAAYLAEIESALPGVRWGELQISSAVQPPVLKVRITLLGDLGAPR